MTTKNIQDVVAERVEEIIKSIKPNIRFREDMGGFAKKECEDVIKQLWEIQERKLTQTLTQLVKEVEEGERELFKK